MIQCQENNLSIRKSNIFKRKTEINAFFKKAKKISGIKCNVFYQELAEGNGKVAFFVLKRSGKAFERIHSKRICREFYRMNSQLFAKKNVIFIIKSKIRRLKDFNSDKEIIKKHFSINH